MNDTQKRLAEIKARLENLPPYDDLQFEGDNAFVTEAVADGYGGWNEEQVLCFRSDPDTVNAFAKAGDDVRFLLNELERLRGLLKNFMDCGAYVGKDHRWQRHFEWHLTSLDKAALTARAALEIE